MKWEKLKWTYSYVKHKKNPETVSYGNDRSLISKKTEKERSNDKSITETKKKT